MLYSLYMVSLSFLYSSFFYVNVTGSFVPPNGDEPADVVRQIICLRFISVYYYYSPARPYLILDPSRCSYLVTIRPRKIRKKEKKRSLFVCFFFSHQFSLCILALPYVLYISIFLMEWLSIQKKRWQSLLKVSSVRHLWLAAHTPNTTRKRNEELFGAGNIQTNRLHRSMTWYIT